MLTLSTSELAELTGYRQAGKQRSWLDERAIPYRDDGRLLVSRSAVEAWLSGKDAPRYAAVNLDAVR